MTVNECVHHWKIGLTHRENGVVKTLEHCLKCFGERHLVVDRTGKVELRKYTGITYPEGREVITSENLENIMSKANENKDKKAEITEYYNGVKDKWGAIQKTADHFNLPKSTMRGLLIRWGLLVKHSKKRKTPAIKADYLSNIIPIRETISEISASNKFIIELVNHALAFSDIASARIYWQGVKDALEIGGIN